MQRLIRNLSCFGLGVLIALGLVLGTAQAQVPDVGGPFSPYPPHRNPWTDPGYRNAPGNVATTSTGVTVTRPGYTTVATKAGEIRIPVSPTVAIDRGALARGIAKAARLTPGGIAFGIVVDYGISKGITQCQQHGWCKTEVQPGGYSAGWGQHQYGIAYQYGSGQQVCEIRKQQIGWTRDVFFRPGTPTSTQKGEGITAIGSCTDANWNPFGDARTYSPESQGETKITPAAPPVDDPGFIPWLKDSQGNTPGRGNPELYDTTQKEGGDVENPATEPNLPVTWNAPPVTTEPTTRTSTQQNADGTTSTRRDTTTTTYRPNTQGTTNGNTSVTNVTNTTTTVTTITNNSTGVSTTTTDTVEEDKPADAFSDTAFGDVPKLYEQKYPDGLSGAWNKHKPNLEGTQFWAGIKQMFPDISGRGGCPAWSMSFDLGAAGNFGTMPINVPCWIFQAIGLIILTTAAFTARKIIF